MPSERTLGGLDVFLPYMKDYVSTYQGTSITTEMWREHLYKYFRENGGEEKIKALDSVNWDVSDSYVNSPRPGILINT
jgi:leukotriene-A4 hydrolase